jgi:RND family efflux transporter MFP subunit
MSRFHSVYRIGALVSPAFLLAAALCSAQATSSQGIVEPFQDSKVSASAAGIVVAINAKEGQFVRKGDVVVELDSELESLEVERRKTIAESMVEINAAHTRVETLGVDLEGTRKLRESTRSVSGEDFRKKELEYKLAEADLQQLEVTKKREVVEYRIADAQLKKRVIAAPFDGIIVQRLLEVGESCNQQQPLFRIVNVRQCRLVVHMEKAQSLKLTSGKQVLLRIREIDGTVTATGVVEFVSPLVDASSGLREVKVLFDNPDDKVHPGVTGTIVTEK